jgi:membrane-associated HD superfamily phosphohydrolase
LYYLFICFFFFAFAFVFAVFDFKKFYVLDFAVLAPEDGEVKKNKRKTKKKKKQKKKQNKTNKQTNKQTNNKQTSFNWSFHPHHYYLCRRNWIGASKP